LDSQDNVADAHDEGPLLAVEASASPSDGPNAAGTVNSWLIWNLTGSVESGLHLTDVTNTSRTGLMNIHTQTWGTQLVTFYWVPTNIMPRIFASGGHLACWR
jgi:glycerol kinase